MMLNQVIIAFLSFCFAILSIGISIIVGAVVLDFIGDMKDAYKHSPTVFWQNVAFIMAVVTLTTVLFFWLNSIFPA